MKITDIITEAANPAQQAAIAISMKKAGKKPKKGVAEGSGGNWYIRVNGKILNDTKFKPVIFSSEDEARSHAMKLADKKRIPLSQMKLTKSWMDAPEQGVAEGSESDAYGNTGEKHECGSCDGTGIDTYDDECPECGGKGWVRDKESLKKKGVVEMDKSQTPPGRDGSNDSDAGKKEYTAKATTAKKVAKDAEKILNKELNKKKGVAEGSDDLVRIEYWQQETMESGRWVKTKPIPRATAEKIVNSFERGEIVDVEQGVAEGDDDHIWGSQGRFAGDTHVNVGDVAMKMIQVGDIVKYFGQKAEVVAMSKDRKRARITRGGITQDVNTSDLTQLGQGMAEDTELVEEFDLIESIVEMIAEHNGVDADVVWADLESLTEDELYVFAVTSDPLMEDWQKANKRDKTDGMSQKAVNAYRRENPGSKLKTAVTTKPSKLKKGGKASKRRKSYCSRSRGQMKMHSISCAKTPDKAICKARRRWNC